MKLSMKEKLSYGLGAFGKDMVCQLVFVYIMVYFTDILGLNAAFVGTMFFIARIWDALNDIFMGTIVDNTRSRFGKFKPWLVIGTLVNVVVYILLFTRFGGISAKGMYVYATVFYILWGMTYTIMDIPYWSMLPNLTSDKTEREKVSVIPRTFASCAFFIIGGFGLQFVDRLGGGSSVAERQMGFHYISIIIAVLFVFTIGLTVFNVKDRKPAADDKAEKISLLQAFRIIRQNDQLLVTIGIILFYNLATQIVVGVSMDYFKYVVGGESLFSVFTAVCGIAEMAGLIAFPKLVSLLSRKKVYTAACVFPLVGLGLLLAARFAAPGSVAAAALCAFLFKFGSGLQLGSVTVILADVVDYGEYKAGTRNESVTFSMQTLLVKFSSAMGSLFTGFALDLTGYVPNVVQSTATKNGITIVMILLPAVCACMSLLVYKRFFKLDGIYYDKIMSVLETRKSSAPDSLILQNDHKPEYGQKVVPENDLVHSSI